MRPGKETVSTVRLPFMGGVDLMRAHYVTQHFSRHYHEGYAVGYIEQGAMRFRYLGESHVAPAGQINLVVPGEAHDGHAAVDNGWTYSMFYLPPEALREAAQAFAHKPELPHFRQGVINDPALARCIRITHRTLADETTPLLEKETRLHWLLAHWIDRHSHQSGSLRAPGKEHDAVIRARNYIRDCLGDDMSLDDVARAANLSPFHLVRVFEKNTGVTPHAYLIQERVRAARERLPLPARLADIAAELGFSDQAHLTRLFKRQYGVTPGAYRKMLQNG